ncbi:hypothetical protein MNV49_006953 [Pseudohyphozyma bogoriensis]|nr:hypothetical protein MNV49_006953 [Pseudohyphozyma bogoriensis]
MDSHMTPAATASSAAPDADEYTVVVRSQTFHLTRAQLETDSPNFFTAAFLDHDFSESSSRTLRLSDRHPDLFRIIVDHLSAYEVLPLYQGAFPNMSVEAAMVNLMADAEYFGLDELRAKLWTAARGTTALPFEATGFSKLVLWEDVSKGKVKFEVPESVKDWAPETRARIAGQAEGDSDVLFVLENVTCSLDCSINLRKTASDTHLPSLAIGNHSVKPNFEQIFSVDFLERSGPETVLLEINSVLGTARDIAISILHRPGMQSSPFATLALPEPERGDSWESGVVKLFAKSLYFTAPVFERDVRSGNVSLELRLVFGRFLTQAGALRQAL